MNVKDKAFSKLTILVTGKTDSARNGVINNDPSTGAGYIKLEIEVLEPMVLQTTDVTTIAKISLPTFVNFPPELATPPASTITFDFNSSSILVDEKNPKTLPNVTFSYKLPEIIDVDDTVTVSLD